MKAKLYADQFTVKHDFPLFEGRPRTLIIASTPRCGSHMLGHVLHQTGKFGFPLEYLQHANLREWQHRLRTAGVMGTLQEVKRRRTSPNGVFSIKLHHSQAAAIGGASALRAAFPDACYLLLRRVDVVAQAVSYSIASQTGVFIYGQEPIREQTQYNFRDVDRCLREVIKDHAAWRYLLACSGCMYLEMTYESIREDMLGAIRKIAEMMGVDVRGMLIPTEPVTKVQRDSRNQEWAAQFLQQHNNASLFRARTTYARLRNYARKLKAR